MEPKECFPEMGSHRKGKGRKEVRLRLERFRVEMLRGGQGAWLQRGLSVTRNLSYSSYVSLGPNTQHSALESVHTGVQVGREI